MLTIDMKMVPLISLLFVKTLSFESYSLPLGEVKSRGAR